MTTVEVVARTIWGEARNQGDRGMLAVACVIANRVSISARTSHRDWFGEGWVGVCRAKWQFSCWNSKDPNRAKLLSVDRRNAQYRTAFDIAERVIFGRYSDITRGATHYLNPKAVKRMPKWATPDALVTRIGAHDFYKVPL